MSRLLAVMALIAACGCDPVWGVSVELRDASDRPVSDATVALACDDNTIHSGHGFSIRSDARGEARLGGIGSALPVGCDLYIAKPGLAPLRIPYRELCPDTDGGCKRVFDIALVVTPCPRSTWGGGERRTRCLAIDPVAAN